MIVDTDEPNTNPQNIEWPDTNQNMKNWFDEGPMLETLDYTIRIGSTPTFLYFFTQIVRSSYYMRYP